MWGSEARIPDWFVKNKVPLRNRAGKAVGVAGILQSSEGMKHALIRMARPIAEIALSLGDCDESAFSRKFRRNTGRAPML